MDSNEQISFIEEYSRESSAVAASLVSQTAEISTIADVLFEVISDGGRIYTCGNGGSACDAMHFAEELVARYLRERPGIPAQHLIDSGTMTCWGNDYDFDSIFQRQVETLMTPKDALVGFTTSGNSQNVIKAVESAAQMGGVAIALCGKSGGKVLDVATHSLIIKSQITSHIQEAHMMLVHILCDLLEQRLFPECV